MEEVSRGGGEDYERRAWLEGRGKRVPLWQMDASGDWRAATRCLVRA